MSAKRYYWLKLKEDFFLQPRIKKLRRIAGGDTYTIIYLKMQLLSIKNDGIIAYEGIEDSFAEEIALTIDEDVDNVNFTLLFLQSQGLIEEVNKDEFMLVEAVKSIGSESDSAERVRKHRQAEKQKALQCNGPVTQCNTEKEKDIEIDKDTDTEKIRDKNISEESPAGHSSPIDFSTYLEIYNSSCSNLPSCRRMTEKRKKAIRSFTKDFTLDDFREICRKANASDFLTGKNDRGWKANIDFLLRTDKAANILEGGTYGSKPDYRDRYAGYDEGDPF